MREEGESEKMYSVCKTDTGFYALYRRQLARHRKDICINPIHGGNWLYSDKDPGGGMENVVVATNDPEILGNHPELGQNEIFNDYIKLISK